MAAKDQSELLRQAELLCNQAKVLAEQAQKVIKDIQEPTVGVSRHLKWICPDCGTKHSDLWCSDIKPATVWCEPCDKDFTVNR